MTDDTSPPKTDKIVELVIANLESVIDDLLRRSQLGIKKYGMTLGENRASHRDRLQHAYEEALDLANYLKWAMVQIDEGQHGDAVPKLLHGWQFQPDETCPGLYLLCASPKEREDIMRSLGWYPGMPEHHP